MSTIANSIRETFARVLMPPTCCLCGARGVFERIDLCDVCVTLLPLNPSAPGASCLFDGTLVRLVVPFQYAYPVDHLIRGLKFRGERVYARVLGTLLAQYLRSVSPPLPDLVMPIPLHAQRYRERGFNQALELARFTAPHLGIRIDARSLMRKIYTLEQSGLPILERRRNVRGAFAVIRAVKARRVALLDDVLTTGSTTLAAAQALLDAGVPEVELWAIARVL